MNRTRTVLAAAAVVAALALAACGGGQPAAPAAPPAPAQTGQGAQTGQAGQGVRIGTASSASLGTIVVGPDGRTLYRFDKDTTSPPTSNCYDACATAWPPLLAPGGQQPTADGVDAGLLGTVARKDGSMQVTLAGSPLYYYAKDTAAGQTTGHDVNGVWFAVTPTGAKASSAPAPAPSGGSGY